MTVIEGRSVALVGNVANSLLPVALALRQAGIRAELFDDERAALSARPESVDPSYANAPWIHRGSWFGPTAVLAPWRAPIVELLREYDIVVASGAGPIVAQWGGTPFCWWVSGGDLTVTPFPIAFRAIYPTLGRKLAALPMAMWQRRAASRAHRVWIHPFAPFQGAADRLHLASPPVSTRRLPVIVDVEEFRPDMDVEGCPELAPVVERMRDAELVVFHPSRMLIKATRAYRRAGQWKGNDHLLRGFAAFVRESRSDSLLVLPDASASRDLDLAKRLVVELGIADRVLWARPPSPEGFSRRQVRHLYLHSDVVADEFAAGWFGFVTLEGLAMGLPVLCRVDEQAMRQLYPDGHPIISADSDADIARRLEDLRSADARQRIGLAGREWVVQHHSAAAAGPLYVDAVREALESTG